MDLDKIPKLDLMSEQQECEIWQRSNEGDLMNQDLHVHWVLILSCDVFNEYFSIKMFISNTMD